MRLMVPVPVTVAEVFASHPFDPDIDTVPLPKAIVLAVVVAAALNPDVAPDRVILKFPASKVPLSTLSALALALLLIKAS